MKETHLKKLTKVRFHLYDITDGDGRLSGLSGGAGVDHNMREFWEVTELFHSMTGVVST